MDKGDSSTSNRVRLGDFEIQKKVGEGGMGTVFMARQVSLDRVVALKILPKSFADNPEFVERFRREARAAASLVHPNVVQVYSVGEERGVPYFAMEFVDGRSLEAAIKSGARYSVREAAELATGVARALEAAHEKGLVHRDIKPANIMLDRKENVKVTDFGLAKPSSGSLDITQPGLVVGTPTYMSPEQGAGEDCDTTSDIYSLGVVLYEMLTGTVPFASDNVGTIIYKHLHEPPTPPAQLNSSIPRPLEQIVLKCLGKHPEDRYASPGELVGALSAFLKGETSTDPTMILTDAGIAAPAPPAAGAAPLPSDVTMPTPAPVAVNRQTPPPTVTPQPTATPATLMQPVQPRKGRGALKGFVAAMLLVAGGGAIYHYWPQIAPHVERYTGIHISGPVPGPGPRPESGSIVTPGKGNGNNSSNGNPGSSEALFELSLSPLEKLLPAGSKVELLAGGKSTAIDLASPPSLRLPAGSYQLNFSRRGYQSATWRISLSSEGVEPALDAESISARPTEALSGPYLKAEQLLAGGKARDAAAALESLKEVEAIDPAFRETARLRTRAARALADAEKRWKQELRTAEELTKQKKWTEASATYKKIADESPVDHRLHGIAQSGQDRAGGKLAKISALVAELKSRVAKGQCEAPKIAGLRNQLLALSVETAAMKELFNRAAGSGAVLKKADSTYLAGKYDTAAKLFGEVLKFSPQCARARELKTRCDALVKTTNKIERAVSAAEGQYQAGDYAACLLALEKLSGQKLGNFEKKVRALRARAQQGLETGKVEVQLGRMDSAFAGLDFSALKKDVVDFRPEGAAFLEGFESQFRSLASAGIEVSAWNHKLDSLKVERSAKGDPLKATAAMTWSFELKLPRLSKSVTGSMPMRMSFKRLGQKWLLAAAAPAGKPTARTTGAGPARARITGKVSAVKGTILTIDRGRQHGVAPGMVFNVFSQARVVHLPLTGEKLFVEERAVAVAEVIDVAATTARCSLAPDTTASAVKQIRVGMPVSLSPAKTIARTFPVIAGISASPRAVPAGERLTISLDVKPLPGVFVTYKWSAAGGVLSSRQTGRPVVYWRAPAAKGPYTVSATVVTPAGQTQRHSVTVNSTGTPAAKPRAYALEAVLCTPELFQSCGDVAFDSRGYAYALDTRKRTVAFFDDQFSPAGSSARFDSANGFERIAVHADRLYCLDTRNMSVKSYQIGQTVNFSNPSGPEIGGKGSGNGNLSAPVDLAFSPDGELYVLDVPATGASVQVFSREARYIQSFGSATRGEGHLEKPVGLAVDRTGAVHVLDAQRLKVVSFRNGRPLGAFKCAPKTAALTDIAYDATTDSLLILDSASGQATAFSPAGKRRGTVIGSKAGLGSLRGATRLAASSAGSVLAVSGAGKFLSRFSASGSFRGVIGGSPLSTGCRIAAGPRETLLALDTATSVTRVFDRNGWLLSEFGDRKAIRRAADLVCDGDGLVYVLDSSAQNVKAFDLAGRPKGTYGKRGRVPEGMDGAIDIATDGSKLLAVLCYQHQNSIFHYGIGKRKPSRGWPPERKATYSPQCIAVDSQGRTFVLNKKGQMTVWDERRKNLGVWPVSFRSGEDIAACAGRVFVLDSRAKLVMACDAGGGELARIKLPRTCSRPADIAPSNYEVLYLFDAGSRSVLKYRAKR